VWVADAYAITAETKSMIATDNSSHIVDLASTEGCEAMRAAILKRPNLAIAAAE
jgi:hypothetical protein